MEKRGFRLDQTAKHSIQQVHFIGQCTNDPSLELTVKYPDSFPSKAPRVFTPIQSPLLSRHHHPVSREICTFGQGQSRWSARLTGGDAIDEAERVIADMSETTLEKSDLIDDAPEPPSATYRYESPTYILVPPEIADFGSRLKIGTQGKFKLKFKCWPGRSESRFGQGRGVITAAWDGATRAEAGEYYEQLAAAGMAIDNGPLFRLQHAPPHFENREQFHAWLKTLNIERRDFMAFVFAEQMGSVTASRDAWLVVRSRGGNKPEMLRTFAMDRAGHDVRVPGLSALSQTRVALVGCGSMGSKIGVALAATGVESFALVDCDFLEPDNAVRHEAGVDLFGWSKPEAVAHRIIAQNPRAVGKILPFEIIIGALNDVSQERRLQELLSKSTLVIDTTGDHGVSRFIGDICADLRIPQLYATVTNGAWGGEVVRVIPGKTACWRCWDDQYRESAPVGEPAPGPGIFAPGCDQPTFTGTTYEVGIVANLACEMAVDTLLIRDAARRHFSGDYLRWQLKDSDGNLSPRIEVLEIKKRPDCSACERGGL